MNGATMRRLLLCVAVLLCVASTAVAHEIRPAYLQVTEQPDGTVRILWKTPAAGELRLKIEPVLPDGWRTIGTPVRQAHADAIVYEWIVRPAGPLDGAVVSVTNLDQVLVDVLVRVERADGRKQTTLLRASRPTLMLLAAPSKSAIMAAYARIGVEHIWFGFDHLAFVLGLLLLVRGWKPLLQTITAFTVAHSITLALTVFGVVGLSPAPVEMVIAASILLLALEILRKQAGEESLTTRKPWLVALVFGLIHGAGFAGALSEIGLPPSDIPLALLFFNLGVEVGQIAFVAAVAASMELGRRVPWSAPAWGPKVAPYVLGSLAAMWCLARTPSLF